MSQRFTRRAVLTGGTAWLLTACSAESQDSSDQPVDSSAATAAPATSPSEAASQGATQAEGLDHTSPSSLTVLVNKQHPLQPLSWAPDDLVPFGGQQHLRAEAAEAAQKMLDAAATAGLLITPISGYRSYDTQVQTYQGWVNTQGQELADVASARPGYSEHQTGLAVDLGTGSSCDLQPCFADTAEAQWLAQHCSDYGFVLRFPWQQQEITGYWYESWHFRYIGIEQAREYQNLGANCLEEFWDFGAAPEYSQ